MMYYAHSVEAVCIRGYSGQYFSVFGLNTERYGVSFRVQPECGRIRTKITSNTDTFHAVAILYAKVVTTPEDHFILTLN